MKRIAIAILVSSLASGFAFAQGTCEVQAVSKTGKPLVGAAKASFVKKCKREACEPRAVSAEGKKLSGAAKNSYMKKCETES